MNANEARACGEKNVEALWLSLLEAIQQKSSEGGFRLEFKLPKNFRNRSIPSNFWVRLHNMGYQVSLRYSRPFTNIASGLTISWPYELKPEPKQ